MLLTASAVLNFVNLFSLMTDADAVVPVVVSDPHAVSSGCSWCVGVEHLMTFQFI